MPSKSLDIIPPREKKAKIGLAPFDSERRRKLKIAFKVRNKMVFPILVSSGVVLLGVLSYFLIEPKAEIAIWPKMEEVSFQTQAAALIGIEEVNLEHSQIPGRIIEVEELVAEEFSSSGSKEKKKMAEGIIRVYNNYHLEQVLVATTRFWCFEEDALREFKTKERVVIPPKSSLDVAVVASAAGKEYNVAPCSFSLPGLRGSPRYTAVYGESLSPMTGGEVVEIPVVTEQDLEKAEEDLIPKAFKKSKEALENLAASEGYGIAEGGILQSITESDSLSEPGQEAEKFTYRVKAQTRALVFQKAELENFARKYILSQIPEGKEVEGKSLQVQYLSSKADLEKGRIDLDLKMQANIYSSIDVQALKEHVKGKGPSQIKQDFEAYPEISRAQVRFWPFWVTKVPQDTGKVDIQLNL